jgi:hypothetical protein
MKKILQISIITIIAVMFFSLACEAPKAYPDIPAVSFKSISIEDSVDLDNPNNSKKTIKLTISVVDGDGDVGILGEGNYIYPGFEDLDNRDLYLTLYEKINGVFVEVPVATPNYFGIPYMTPEGQDKTLKADIEVKMDIYKPYYTYDTIKYSFYLYDRQKHMSNIGETPEIPADTIGTVTKFTRLGL